MSRLVASAWAVFAVGTSAFLGCGSDAAPAGSTAGPEDGGGSGDAASTDRDGGAAGDAAASGDGGPSTEVITPKPFGTCGEELLQEVDGSGQVLSVGDRLYVSVKGSPSDIRVYDLHGTHLLGYLPSLLLVQGAQTWGYDGAGHVHAVSLQGSPPATGATFVTRAGTDGTHVYTATLSQGANTAQLLRSPLVEGASFTPVLSFTKTYDIFLRGSRFWRQQQGFKIWSVDLTAASPSETLFSENGAVGQGGGDVNCAAPLHSMYHTRASTSAPAGTFVLSTFAATAVETDIVSFQATPLNGFVDLDRQVVPSDDPDLVYVVDGAKDIIQIEVGSKSVKRVGCARETALQVGTGGTQAATPLAVDSAYVYWVEKPATGRARLIRSPR